MSPVKTLLIAGEDSSLLRALGDLIRTVLRQSDQAAVTILMASSEDEILRTLCRERIDMLIANHVRFDVGYELVRWLNQGQFKMKKVLIGTSPPLSTIDFEADGIDAILTRPVKKDDLERVLRCLLLG